MLGAAGRLGWSFSTLQPAGDAEGAKVAQAKVDSRGSHHVTLGVCVAVAVQSLTLALPPQAGMDLRVHVTFSR